QQNLNIYPVLMKPDLLNSINSMFGLHWIYPDPTPPPSPPFTSCGSAATGPQCPPQINPPQP
ncbi:hypothetical protein KKF91_05255, partial [Myxococcota bacterium]|nr:hypothetical protein [Myxococcota bacterium]